MLGLATALVLGCGDAPAPAAGAQDASPAAEARNEAAAESAREASGAAASSAGVAVEDPFASAPPGDSAAVYLRVRDVGGGGDRLVGASSPDARMAMLHRTVQHEGMAHMEHVEDGIAVPPGGEAVLAPGGAHVMLVGLRTPLAPGDALALTLHFERAGDVAVRVPVLAPEEAAAREAAR